MIEVKNSGGFKNLEKLFSKVSGINYESILERYGREGALALALATPVDTGLTATSWNYIMTKQAHSLSITWTNSHIVNNVPIAVIIQYGHATRNGGYVQGRDYINPALKPIFDKIANSIWEEVTR